MSGMILSEEKAFPGVVHSKPDAKGVDYLSYYQVMSRQSEVDHEANRQRLIKMAEDLGIED